MTETGNRLADLEAQLRELSHDARPLELIQAFAEQLGKTKQRQMVFGTEYAALLRIQPIMAIVFCVSVETADNLSRLDLSLSNCLNVNQNDYSNPDAKQILSQLFNRTTLL